MGSSKRQISPEQQRILELEKEVKQLREANDILKKSACVLSDRSCQEKYTLTSHRIDRQLVCDAFNYALAHQGYPTA